MKKSILIKVICKTYIKKPDSCLKIRINYIKSVRSIQPNYAYVHCKFYGVI